MKIIHGNVQGDLKSNEIPSSEVDHRPNGTLFTLNFSSQFFTDLTHLKEKKMKEEKGLFSSSFLLLSSSAEKDEEAEDYKESIFPLLRILSGTRQSSIPVI